MVFEDQSRQLLAAIDGRPVVYVANDNSGNWGDRLIDVGTVHWLRTHVDRWVRVPESAIASHTAGTGSVTLLFGSGSVGASAAHTAARRRKILERFRQPAILLPSSISDAHEDLSRVQTVFVRDHFAAALLRDVHPDVRLCPDLAEWTDLLPVPILDEEGLWLRRDDHAPRWTPQAAVDPIARAQSLEEYVALAGRYRHLTTNRLHLAIAARLHGRRVTLVPCRWHKVRAYYETWYQDNDLVDWKEEP
jgi:exopolysaccharide biosynthesis predicted pyruvyltransferase EpsI